MSSRLEQANARAAAARARLTGTLGEIRERLDPRVLTRDVFDEIAEGGQKALSVGADVARRNSGKIAATAALAGIFFARNRIASLFGGGKKDEKPARDPRVAGNRADDPAGRNER